MTSPSAGQFSTQFSSTQWHGRRPAYATGGPIHIPPEAPATLTEALLRRADQRDSGVTYIQKDGQEDFQSYADLLREARHILGGLRALGLQPRDRVILQIDNLRHHFTTFWACVLGGFTPVTVAVPASYAEKNGVVSKLWNTWKLLKNPLIITSARLEKAIQGLGSFLDMPGLRTTAVEPLAGHAPAENIYPSRPEDLVFFQLTSGSTGVPKCIQETHRGIIHHIHGAAQFNGYQASNITLNWLPVDHVVPILTSHLKDVYLGCRQIHVKSDLVLSDPLRWLDLMDKHRVTHTWSPNFGFKLVSDRLAEAPGRNWDLSALEFMMNAGEQVTLPVAADFLARTARFGVRPQAMQPSFGMAEVCTCMTYQNNFTVETGVRRFKKSSLGSILESASKDDPAAVTFVDLGPPVPGVEIRITDSQNRVVPEGVIGRFQIRGAVVTPGYLDNDAANQEAFVGEGWFNSGDLGFILDGRLTLTGREKEMIIVRGANFYCYEIEDVVNAIEGVEPTFVSSCAVPDPATGTEGLAILFVPKASVSQGVNDQDSGRLASLVKQIKTRVASSLGINPAFVIPLRREAFLKTTSGKIQRNQMKKNFEAGEYNAVLEAVRAAAGAENSAVAARDELEEKLLGIWRDLLRCPALGVRDNFFESGGDSLLAARLIARVEDLVQLEIPLHVLFEGGGTVEGLARHIRQGGSERSRIPAIEPRAEDSWAPASLGQQRLWLLDQLNPGCPAYNVGTLTKISGPLNEPALQAAFLSLIDRHESLRARFDVSRGVVCQFFDAQPAGISSEKLSAGDFQSVYEAACQEAGKPFDLQHGPLLRACLFKTGSSEQYLCLVMHQTITDGWSLKVFFRELFALYCQHAQGLPPVLSDLPVRFGDFAAWQREWLDGATLEKQMAYWRKELSGDLAEIDLPIDLPRPRVQTFVSETQLHRLPADLSEAVRGLAKEQGATVYMVLLAAFQSFLSNLANQKEVLVGTAIAGRNRTELENLIGFFVNTVAMRASFAGNPSFTELLAQTRKKTVAAYEHQYAPFEKIVHELQPARISRRPPIFQTWFGTWESIPAATVGGVDFQPVRVFMPGAQFELSLFAIDASEIELIWEFRSDLFLPSTVERYRQQFQSLLRRILAEPGQPLRTILASLNDEDPARRLQSKDRLRDGLRSARRKPVQIPS